MKTIQEKTIELPKSESLFNWTIDVESDWGGRIASLDGIKEGIPYILETFEAFHIKAIFFLSTKYIVDYLPIAKKIQEKGHTIGNHGHEHVSWRGRPWWQWRLDYMKSCDLLKEHLGISRNKIIYRAPKFSYKIKEQLYSNPINHISLLKQSWMESPFGRKSIFYLHPFDVIDSRRRPPNLFCSILYSRPKKVRTKFESYVRIFQN